MQNHALSGTHQFAVKINAHSVQDTLGEVRIQYWNKRTRLLRASKGFGLALLLAVGAVFIPILHFILVPLLLLAMPMIAIYFYRQASVVVGGKGQCPKCLQPFTIVRSANLWPLEDLCEFCHEVLKINLLDYQ